MLLKIVFMLMSFFWSICSYNNFNQLKRDMEKKADNIALAIEEILQKKCEKTEFDCPVKSFNICQGTDVRQCLLHFPTSNSCNGLSKYSMTSGVRIPSATASFDLSEETKFNLCKTAEAPFENKLQEMINRNEQKYAWVNFGFSDGSHRLSPGFKYEKQQTSQSCKDYDPRLRPWFSTNVYRRKKMVILVENSKRIYEHSTRNQSIKLSLQALLKTGDNGDYFNVIQFADVPKCLINYNDQQESKLVSLGSQIATYNNRTGTEGQYYEALTNNITKSLSSQVNYKAALEMAIQILNSSKFQNTQYENFIMMFAGFQPSNFSSLNIQKDFHDYLLEKQKQLQLKLTFFGFGVDMIEERGKQLLKNLSCTFNGIFFDLSNIKYESMFLDQARGFYDYLSQGNQLTDYRWTNFYEDAFGLGRMTTVVRAAYYKEKNVTRLIGVAGIDVLVSQMTIYKSQNQLKYELSVTEPPFKRNISLCALETIRRKNRCYTTQQSNCDYYEFCQPKLSSEVKSVMRKAEDFSNDSCCPFDQKSQVGLIVGVVIGCSLGILLIALLVYCLIFRKGNSSELQQTYIEIFSKFKDFDHTRIRTDSETSLIKD